MNNIQEQQKDLILCALMNTDNYLFILDAARKSGVVSDILIKEFEYFKNEATKCLLALGCFHEHSEYMRKAYEEMLDMYNDANEFKIEEMQSFKKFITEIKQVEPKFSDKELDEMANSIKWEDIYDLYDENEIVKDGNLKESFYIDEALSPQARLKKSLSMARRKSQIAIARNIKLRRASTIETLKKRAVVAAKRAMYKKLLMGRKKSQLSAGEKDVLEARIRRMKSMQSILVVKLLPVLRNIEQKRLAR